jgi:hypothetical protein
MYVKRHNTHLDSRLWLISDIRERSLQNVTLRSCKMGVCQLHNRTYAIWDPGVRLFKD